METDCKKLSWSGGSVASQEVRLLLKTLGEEYPICEDGDGLRFSAELLPDAELSISQVDGEVKIIAAELSQVARGVGKLLAEQGNAALSEKTSFKTRGVMIDCSRGAVFKVSYLKQWLRRLSLFGYNFVMLYTQDNYELPGEEYFGYMRGRYSADELREVDQYASQLGIEMVGTIQVLGHLHELLRWPAYSEIRDTESVMMVGENKTYELIEKMLDFYSSVFKSRRIHIGMDETHDLGRGRYMDINGYRHGFELFNEHLDRVVGQCEKYDFKPIIWSDMYFRLGNNKGCYYDKETLIPDDVVEKIPAEVQLTYWDYYHEDEGFYTDWIRRHKALGSLPLMASGIWTWPNFWYDHHKTADAVTPCIAACQAENVDEIVFTMWGDDGAYCDWDSALAGACYVAERLYNGNAEPAAENLEQQFDVICGGSFKAHALAGNMSHVEEPQRIVASNIVWDDPLLRIYWTQMNGKKQGFWEENLKRYSDILTGLEPYEKGQAGDIEHAKMIIKLIEQKIQLNLDLAEAYPSRDMESLKEIQNRIPDIINLYEKLSDSFRKQWYSRCKPFGFEVTQTRLASLVARYKELQTRLKELLTGEIDCIPELDETIITAKGEVLSRYKFLATALAN